MHSEIKYGKVRVKKSVLLSWSISYLIVLLIPTVMFFAYYGVTSKAMESEVLKANELILNNLSQSADKLIKNAKAAASFAYVNTNVAKLFRPARFDAFFRYNAVVARNALRSYTLTDSSVEYLIFFRDNGYILTSETANGASYLYNAYRNGAGQISYDDWIAVLSADYENQYMVGDFYTLETERSVVFANTSKAVNATVFVSVPLSHIADYAQSLNDSSFLLMDDSGWVLAAYGAETGIERIDPTDGGVTGEEETRYICSIQAAENGWYYAIATPEGSFWQTSRSLTQAFIWSMGGALLVGILCAYLLLRRNYRPVGSLVSALGATHAGNEFELIKNRYNSLVVELGDMNSALTEQRAQLRGHFLLACLKGRKNPCQEDAQSHYRLDFAEKTLVLVAVSMDCEEAELSHELNLFAVKDIFGELMQAFPFYLAEDGYLLYYLLCLTPQHLAQWKETGEQTLQKACGVLADKLFVNTTCAISRTVDNPALVHHLYSEAMDALEFKSLIGESGVIRASDIHSAGMQASVRQEEVLHLFSQAVGSGDLENARSLSDGTFTTYRGNTALGLSALRIVTASFLSAMMLQYNEAFPDESRFSGLAARFDEVMLAPDIDALQASFNKLLTFVCESASRSNAHQEDTLVSQITDYVAQNYADHTLNISKIADILRKNPQYLSRMFRSQRGVGLLDYINNFRVTQARRILAQRNLSQEQLIKEIGFTNVRTYRRAFQKAESNFHAGRHNE